MKRTLIGLAMALNLVAPEAPATGTPGGLTELRAQLDALRAEYEKRLRELEARLQAAEALAGHNSETLAAEGGASAPTTVAPRSANAFNPAVSVILQGSLNSYSENPGSYRLPGFPLGGEAGLVAEGLSLDETEVTASANVDSWFYAQTTLAFHDSAEGSEAEVEEAYIDTLGLPAGLSARFGRFYSAVGYLNPFHTHAWDFRDAPLAYRAFLGKQYRDDGVQLSWVLPSDWYVRLGGEVLAGSRFPAGESRRSSGDVRSLFVELGGDAGVSNAWLRRAGSWHACWLWYEGWPA